MPRLKRPLDPTIVEIANDELAQKYPELIGPDGKIILLDPDNPDHAAYISEWNELYILNGGEVESELPLNDGRTKRAPCFPYVHYEEKKRLGDPIHLPDFAHVFYAASNAIYADEYWPLREYYVYMDIDPSDKIDFDTLGLLWTDENGYPHYTDGEGNPTERVPLFPLAWSKKISDFVKSEGDSTAIVYDRDIQKLKQKRSKVEQEAGGGPLPEKYRIDLMGSMRQFGNGTAMTVVLFVPPDEDSLNVPKLKELMKECDDLRAQAKNANDAIYKFITKNTTHKTLFFNRQTIDAWLDEYPNRRTGLITMGTGGKTLYEVSCQNFDRDLNKLVKEHDKVLVKFLELFDDKAKMEQLSQIDFIVEDVWEPSGEHLLWRHQFMCEALGHFSGTTRQNDAYKKYVEPILTNVNVPYGSLRNKCKCKTCAYFEANKTTVANPPQLVPEPIWKSKDLKLGTRTGLRVIDLATKFRDNIGYVIAANKLDLVFTSGAIAKFQVFAKPFFDRMNLFKDTKIAPTDLQIWGREWEKTIQKHFDLAKKAEGTLAGMQAEIKAMLEKEKVPRARVTAVADGLTLIGAAAVFWYVFTKEGKLTGKDVADFLGGVTDVMKASVSLGKEGFQKKLIAKYGEEAGKRIATIVPRWISFGGGVFQVASAYISLSDAADKGDAREYGWAGVSYFGASVAMAGLALDVMPEPVVTKGSGILLNFVGGIIYLVGSAGEFITRPDEVERYLRSEYWYQDPIEIPRDYDGSGGVRRGTL